jgi:hypothetical protein
MAITDWTNVWWPIVTAERCTYPETTCWKAVAFEEERTAEQLAARIKPRLRCPGHLPPGARIERYEEDNMATTRGEA